MALMKVSSLQIALSQELPCKYGSSPTLEAEIIIRHALRIDRTQFYASLNLELTQDQLKFINLLFQRRLTGEPLPYIIGKKEFFGLELNVCDEVLIPRQETEILVEVALDFASSLELYDPIIVDVGTGSGAIALALSTRMPKAAIYGVDISHKALMVANKNKQHLEVGSNVTFLQSDLLTSFRGPVHIIVSNPPYISYDAKSIANTDLSYEPRLALDGGKGGIEVIRRLYSESKNVLNKHQGCIIVEISPEQECQILELARTTFPNSNTRSIADLSGSARAVVSASP